MNESGFKTAHEEHGESTKTKTLKMSCEVLQLTASKAQPFGHLQVLNQIEFFGFLCIFFKSFTFDNAAELSIQNISPVPSATNDLSEHENSHTVLPIER